MSTRVLSVWGLALLCASLRPARAQVAGGQGPLLLQSPASVRSAGLNGAGAAIVGYAGAVFANPAGLATISHIGLEGGVWEAPLDGYATSAALGWRIRQFDLGLGLQYYDPGPSTVLDNTKVDYEVLGVGSLVYRFGLIALGGSAKGLRQVRGTDIRRGFSADVGFAIAVFDIMALGFAVQNVGGNWRTNEDLEMPHLTRTGFTMNYTDPQETVRLLSTLEVQWPEGRGARLVLGGEAGIVLGGVGVIGRVAYGERPEGTEQPEFTFGATLELGVAAIDGAVEPRADGRAAVRRIGLRLAL